MDVGPVKRADEQARVGSHAQRGQHIILHLSRSGGGQSDDGEVGVVITDLALSGQVVALL